MSNNERIDASKLAQLWGWAGQSILTMASTTSRDDMELRFPLLFQHTAGEHPLGFYFYAAKTALNRIDAINGDQGFMLSRTFFKDLAEFQPSGTVIDQHTKRAVHGNVFQPNDPVM